MIYFINYSYKPNTAISNRLDGYYSTLDKLGIAITIIYLFPNKETISNIKKYTNIKTKYWNSFFAYDIKICRMIVLFINLLILKLVLQKGDIAYTYGINKITDFLSNIDGIKVYGESTEHPSIICGGKLTSLDESQIYKIVSKLDGVFVISEALKKLYIQNGCDERKVIKINMTVDPNRFLNLQKDKNIERYIAYCGTASNNKDGVDELIKAFAIVVQSVPKVKLYIIGKTPDMNDEAGNLRLIERLGLGDRVIFTGVVPAYEMPKLLKNAEVLALDRPDSLQAQCGFPTKLGEYLLTGNPVVVTKVGDIPLFLKDGDSALLAEERNSEDFSNKLIWALKHPEESRKIGSAGKKVALENFNCVLESNRLIQAIMSN